MESFTASPSSLFFAASGLLTVYSMENSGDTAQCARAVTLPATNSATTAGLSLRGIGQAFCSMAEIDTSCFTRSILTTSWVTAVPVDLLSESGKV